MKMIYQIGSVENVEVTMQITMTFQEWRQFSTQLKSAYPSWRLGNAIGDMVRTMTERIESEHEVPW